MYRPRLDYWRLLTWTYAADNTPLKETLERLDWDQVRDPDHMRVFVSASDIENGKTVYFSNLYPKRKLPGPTALNFRGLCPVVTGFSDR